MVAIRERNGWLALRWGFEGERYQLALKVKDTRIGRKSAEMKARQIEIDMESGQFDPTLARYGKKTDQSEAKTLTAPQLLSDFSEYKKEFVTLKTLEKYANVEKKLRKFSTRKHAKDYNEKIALKFREFLLTEVSPATTGVYLSVVNMAWKWAQEQGLIEKNPWATVCRSLKVPPQSRPKPFTFEEMQAIIQAFENHNYYKIYAPFIRFLFGTGCRTGEAIGLRWGVVYEDCSEVWIGESYKRGKGGGTRGAAKVNKARTIYPSKSIQDLLLGIRPDEPGEFDLVFPSPRKGGFIDDHNFRDGPWTNRLESAGVKYRKFYNTRSTFISHALAAGTAPAKVAEIVGDRVETIYRYYVGNPDGSRTVPDIGV